MRFYYFEFLPQYLGGAEVLSNYGEVSCED